MLAAIEIRKGVTKIQNESLIHGKSIKTLQIDADGLSIT